MIGTNVNNLIAFSMDNWHKRPYPWGALGGGGGAHPYFAVPVKFLFM